MLLDRITSSSKKSLGYNTSTFSQFQRKKIVFNREIQKLEEILLGIIEEMKRKKRIMKIRILKAVGGIAFDNW